MDTMRGLGEMAIGSRLKRLSEYLGREMQLVYDYYKIDFDPYLFPIIKVIEHKKEVTNNEITISLKSTQPAITQSINKLIKKDLVIIKVDKYDKRKKLITLSKKGKQTIKRMRPLWLAFDKLMKELTTHSTNSLIENINKIEDKLNQKPLHKMIINTTKNTAANAIELVSYDNKYAKDFYDLNVEWLKTFFYVEPFDEEVLSNPDKYIINKGGHIFFAKLEGKIVGTVALMPLDEPSLFELTKMAVNPEYRGLKIGQQLMQQCIDFAKSKSLPKLILYSNTKLENAIYIYRKYGFVEIPIEENSKYVRSDIKMELKFG